MKLLSRRDVLRLGGGAAAASRISPGAGRSTDLLSVFDYSQVELLDSPLRRQFDQNHQFFLHLDDDRLLKIYRQRAGLPAPGADMGGWYDDFCPGASFGQYVSALARFAGATGSGETRAKVNRLLRGYAATLDPSGKFFAGLRYPGYTYDKLVCACIDAYSFAGDPDALKILADSTRIALPHMAERALTPEEMRARPHQDDSYLSDETYTFAENLFLAYERTGERRYFDLGSNYLLDRGFFDPLSEGQNVLPGLHAYSHVNALSSGMQGYLKLGKPKYLRAVTNAVDFLLKDQSYATGGWGPDEGFVRPGEGALGRSLSRTHHSFETPCGSYAHFKIMRYLLHLTRNPRYGDSMERVLYNAILGVKPILEDGSSFYYSDYAHSGFKTYKRVIPGATVSWDLDDRWPCCSGTLPQIVADYGISSYLKGDGGIYVNLYVPSRVSWKQDGARCSIAQETDYPAGNLITLTVQASSDVRFPVYLRIPSWAGKGTTISVNGRRAEGEFAAGTFFPVRRSWKTGDRIEIEMDQPLRFEVVDAQTPDQAALLRGSQVLFAIAGEQPGLTKRQMETVSVRSSGGGWLAKADNLELRLLSFSAIRDEIYQTYWKMTHKA